jgi:uncharacterized protein (TIGR02466 family)
MSNYITLWPTVIGEYILDDIDIHNELEAHIKSSFFSSLSISIFDTPGSHRFKLWVISCVDNYLTNINYKSDNIQITRAWANSLEYLDAQPLHSHTNAGIAGVYYLETTPEHPPLEIFDPRTDHVFNKSFTNTKKGDLVSYVSSTYIIPDKFKLILIPAYLRHSVGYNLCKNPRVSVAMNIRV